MQITINGKQMEIAEGITAGMLIQQLKLKPPLALELNQKLCPKSQHERTLLKSGDVLEIVTIVGGG